MALLSNVHKGYQVPLQLRKIEIMQKKIWESRQFEPNGANYRRFDIALIYKIYYTLYSSIQFLK